jgi:hypothetical protein
MNPHAHVRSRPPTGLRVAVPGLPAQVWTARADASRILGNLTAKNLGIAPRDVKGLKGQIEHFYHLAAVCDLSADEESQVAVNVGGTRMQPTSRTWRTATGSCRC